MMATSYLCLCVFLICLLQQNEREKDTKRGVAAALLPAEVTNTGAGAKTEAAAAGRSAAAAGIARAGTAGAPRGTTRSTGAGVGIYAQKRAFIVKSLSAQVFYFYLFIHFFFLSFPRRAATLRGGRGRKGPAGTGTFLRLALNTSRQCSIKLCKVRCQ